MLGKRGVLLGVVTAVAAATAALAHANGGTNIASAPALPIGQGFVSGSTTKDPNGWPSEWFKVPLQASDALTLDYGSTNGASIRIYVSSASASAHQERTSEE